jgi:hypothetical protein
MALCAGTLLLLVHALHKSDGFDMRRLPSDESQDSLTGQEKERAI